jgi:uncharacterized membrane protein YeaQ/YmgE (transglycosylase-associated protein family)
MSTTYILWYLIIGLIAGWVAVRVIRGRGLGLTGNLIVSIFGALMGGYFFDALKLSSNGGTPGAILFATLGSVVMLGLVGWLRRFSPGG